MRFLCIPFTMALCVFNASASESILETSAKSSIKNSLSSKLGFSYGLTYLGPSFDTNAQDGATYNRFNTGQDFNGNDTSGISSQQAYHSTSLSIRVTKNIKLSYSYTFQDDFNKGIKYESTNWDGSTIKGNIRDDGFSNNNQRINAFVTNIYSNNYFFLMSNFYYERPTTDGSINSNMNYGLGIQPTIGIFTPISGLFTGIKASLERDYYKRQEFSYDCNGFTCSSIAQTLRASISPYIGYNISDKLSIKSQFTFDWDQMGDQVDDNSIVLAGSGSRLQLGEFNNNMDNVMSIGPVYKLNKNISFGAKIESVIESPTADKTVLIGDFSMSI
jgi:hypothetical protein